VPEASRTRRLLGLDLGGTNIKTAVVEVDATGAGARVVHTQSGPAQADEGPDHVTARLISMGLATMEAAGPVETTGLGVPGLFDYSTGEIVFFTNLPGPWEGYPLRTRLAEGLGTSATLINDARAFTLAEATLGAGRGCRTLACLTLGTGVGGGLMIEGRLHFGAFGLAGEIGHQTIVPDGPRLSTRVAPIFASSPQLSWMCPQRASDGRRSSIARRTASLPRCPPRLAST